jgi:rhodanese-related sulfurtransferase
MHRSPTGAWPEIKRTIAHEFPHVRSITTAELALWLETADPELPLTLDARDAAEYAVSHLPGAVRINSDALRGNLPLDLLKDTPVVVYCSVGYRSAALAQRLQGAGYTNIRNLDGSIFQWANEGRPLVRGNQHVQEVHPYDENWGRLLDRGVPRRLRP